MNRKPMALKEVIAQLVRDYEANKNLIVYIRADGNSRTKDLTALMDGLSANNITRYSVRETPQNQR
jgi:biopolymer transport protein ExbD